jgi:hypothetical protein
VKERRTLEWTWRLVQECAAAGARCPTNDDMPSGHLPKLARAGKLRIEVSGRNWRRVTILTGPQAGKSTAVNPRGDASVFVVIAQGTPLRHYDREPVDVMAKKDSRRAVDTARMGSLPLAVARPGMTSVGDGGEPFIRPLTKAELMRGRA